MFDHTVIELSGRDIAYPLDFAAEGDENETLPVKQGGLCSLNDNGKFVTGLGDGVANEAMDGKAIMPLIAIQGKEEFDVRSDVGNFSGGVQSALVASGGYEIQTTEFVRGDAYLPNQTLTFGVDETGTGGNNNRGLIDHSADAYSDQHLVGVVSRGENVTEYNKSVLAFWSVFCPPINSAVYAKV
jgi:hypothetical protein